jgi:Phage derived protein Gp49-like (DUF891)
MTRETRPISWISAAPEGFRELPGKGAGYLRGSPYGGGGGRQVRYRQADEGAWLRFFEIALPFRGNAFRVVYGVQIGDAIWVVHAFQKKSTQGIKAPKHEIDLVKTRIKRLKEILR